MINSAAASPAFFAAYALVALLLVNVLFFTRFAWWLKLASTAMVLGLYWSSWQAMPALLGWPATSGMPERFNLSGLYITEPEKNGANKGAIYLWTTRFATANGEVVPRAFQIPFSPELQLKVAGAGTKLRKRMPQLGEVVPGKPAAGGHGAGAIDLNFFDMPDPLFPER